MKKEPENEVKHDKDEEGERVKNEDEDEDEDEKDEYEAEEKEEGKETCSRAWFMEGCGWGLAWWADEDGVGGCGNDRDG